MEEAAQTKKACGRMLLCVDLTVVWLFGIASDHGCVGFIVVCQNFFSPLLNSNPFDFHEGWMYVLGVGSRDQSACELKSST